MINEAQFEEFTAALKSKGLDGNTTNHPTCLIVSDIGSTELITVLGILPSGLKPDEILTQNPPKVGRAWSQYILVFWKDGTTKARGRPPAAKVEDSVKIDG
jgi:hypothetical protein